MQETQVQFLGPEDLLEKEMETHLPGKSLGQRSLAVHGVIRVRDDLATKPPQSLCSQKGEISVTDKEPMCQSPQRAPELSPRKKENASQSKRVACQTIPRRPT